MTSSDQQRTIVLTKLLVGELSVAEPASLMNRSERQVWRLTKGFQRDGPAALVHRNRGRPSTGRLSDETRQRIVVSPATAMPRSTTATSPRAARGARRNKREPRRRAPHPARRRPS